MNCYCSNLIKGHNTHPIDIERALNNDLSADPEQRNLQLAARAHIAVQEWIDAGGLRDRDVQVGRRVAISPGAIPRFARRPARPHEA
ncbi:hypothetical protein SmB9_01020 [Sphingosinicella microcystinivorans]|uniref:Uncharacterized protein n=1 Tax=Sphingosinicella microcystinivorans TaxID=335406 RepID=A0AAD1FZD5_SPHMI|nr:hypothetical protein SmB9_01020 [Sphingosinicella microcystinivorans]